jgi:hypothetical protein
MQTTVQLWRVVDKLARSINFERNGDLHKKGRSTHSSQNFQLFAKYLTAMVLGGHLAAVWQIDENELWELFLQ